MKELTLEQLKMELQDEHCPICDGWGLYVQTAPHDRTDRITKPQSRLDRTYGYCPDCDGVKTAREFVNEQDEAVTIVSNVQGDRDQKEPQP